MAPGLITIERQISAIAAQWPQLRIVEASGRAAVWEGPLRPEKRRYTVRIAYCVPLSIEMFTLSEVQPRVQVLDPLLEPHDDYEEGPIPHVYWNRDDLRLPYLCLFDPFNCEWSPADLLAETTVPWTARYLYFYEGWLLTGRWLGGGRHPTEEERGGGADTPKSIAAV